MTTSSFGRRLKWDNSELFLEVNDALFKVLVLLLELGYLCLRSLELLPEEVVSEILRGKWRQR